MSQKLRRALSFLMAVLTLACVVPFSGTAKAELAAPELADLELHDCHDHDCPDHDCLVHDEITFDGTIEQSRLNMHRAVKPILPFEDIVKPMNACTCITSEAGTYTTKNIDTVLNIRAVHSIAPSSTVVGTIPKGATFSVSKWSSVVAHVTYNGISGFVSSDYIQKIGSSSCSCATSYSGTYTTKNIDTVLNIRADHSLSSSSTVLGTIPKGATFSVSKGNGTVAHVTYNGVSGYSSMAYMQKVSSSSSCSCATSYSGTYTTKNIDTVLNIRADHSLSSSSTVLGTIPKGATFSVSKGNGTVAHVTYNGISGYASMSYMQKVTSTSCTCSTSYAGTYTTKNIDTSLTIRADHSSSSADKGYIPSGATFSVSKGNGTWAHVTYNGTTGYASMSYMQKVTNQNPTPTPTPTPSPNVVYIETANEMSTKSINGMEVIQFICESVKNGEYGDRATYDAAKGKYYFNFILNGKAAVRVNKNVLKQINGAFPDVAISIMDASKDTPDYQNQCFFKTNRVVVGSGGVLYESYFIVVQNQVEKVSGNKRQIKSVVTDSISFCVYGFEPCNLYNVKINVESDIKLIPTFKVMIDDPNKNYISSFQYQCYATKVTENKKYELRDYFDFGIQVMLNGGWDVILDPKNPSGWISLATFAAGAIMEFKKGDLSVKEFPEQIYTPKDVSNPKNCAPARITAKSPMMLQRKGEYSRLSVVLSNEIWDKAKVVCSLAIP